MRSLASLLVILFLVSCFADVAHARRWRRTRSYSTSVSVSFGGTDQQRCYAEAKYMHENRIYRHVGAVIGSFEGFGIGGPGCATCTPNRGMTLTGDAHYGNVRVRSWR